MTLIEKLRNMQESLTPEELAVIFKVVPKTVSDWAAAKVIPGFKVGREWRFDPQEIADYIESTQNAHSRNTYGEGTA
jgi:excisionase family DNA binding protein